MRCYLSFTGRSACGPEALAANIQAITDALIPLGHEVDSSFTRPTDEAMNGSVSDDPTQFANCMEVEFRALRTAHSIISLVQGPIIGTGQSMELAFAKALGLPVVMLSHESAADNFLHPLANYNGVYHTTEELGALALRIPEIVDDILAL